jgi:hypothetical protein
LSAYSTFENGLLWVCATKARRQGAKTMLDLASWETVRGHSEALHEVLKEGLIDCCICNEVTGFLNAFIAQAHTYHLNERACSNMKRHSNKSHRVYISSWSLASSCSSSVEYDRMRPNTFSQGRDVDVEWIGLESGRCPQLPT